MECAMVSFSGGGLKFWLEAYSTSTQTNVSFTPIVADANVSAVIRPKGTGALLASIPDGTATGGNARGTFSIDLQLSRNNANQVAAGASTFIFGGIRNRIASSETRASIFGGEDNVINGGGRWGNVMLGGTRNQITGAHDNACIGGTDNTMSSSAQSSFLGGGSVNTVSGTRANVIGGQNNTASNTCSTVTGGQSNTASGEHTFVGGGQSNSATYFHSVVVGGVSNTAQGQNNFIGGGTTNSLGGTNNTANRVIVGGSNNSIWYEQSQGAFIGGGFNNTVHFGSYTGFIGGGGNGGGNSISGLATTLVGGTSNRVGNGYGNYADYGFLGGGRSNAVDTGASYGALVGGFTNNASGTYSFLGGGANNQASGSYSVVCGGGDAVTAGNRNSISQSYGFIGGGQINRIFASGGTATHGFLGGGNNNQINQGNFQTLCGGSGNSVVGDSIYSKNNNFLGGGSSNSIYISANSVVCGGSSQNLQYGQHCFIGGGSGNYMFDEPYVTIAGGLASSVNTGSQGYVFIGGGRNHSVTKEYTTIGGGSAHTSSGASATISGGSTNTVSATIGTVTGGANAVSSLYGQQSHASGRFSANGDAQAHELIWRRAITGTAQTELFLDGASVAAILPGTNAVWHGFIDIAAICTTTGNGTTPVGDTTATSYKVTIKRIGTTTTLVGTVQEIGTTNQDSMVGCTFLIDNNDTNESLRIQCTPAGTAGSTTVHRVVATFRGLQIQY